MPRARTLSSIGDIISGRSAGNDRKIQRKLRRGKPIDKFTRLPRTVPVGYESGPYNPGGSLPGMDPLAPMGMPAPGYESGPYNPSRHHPGMDPNSIYDPTGGAVSGWEVEPDLTAYSRLPEATSTNPYARGTDLHRQVADVKHQYMQGLRDQDRLARRGWRQAQPQAGSWNTGHHGGGGFGDLFKGVQQGTGGIWDTGSLNSDTGQWNWNPKGMGWK